MDRRTFLKKLSRLSLFVSGVATLGAACRCNTHGGYADVCRDYQDYCDYCDSPYGKWHCNTFDYCNHASPP